MRSGIVATLASGPFSRIRRRATVTPISPLHQAFRHIESWPERFDAVTGGRRRPRSSLVPRSDNGSPIERSPTVMVVQPPTSPRQGVIPVAPTHTRALLSSTRVATILTIRPHPAQAVGGNEFSPRAREGHRGQRVTKSFRRYGSTCWPWHSSEFHWSRLDSRAHHSH